MDELLVLTHRIPYPPDKGDKIRSWHFIQHLARRYDIYLGTFVDDRRDWEFTQMLRGICRECFFVRLDPHLARLRSLSAFPHQGPLTVSYYYDRTLHHWTRGVLGRPRLRRAFIYCSAMAQYIPLEMRGTLRSVADLVDVDSEKWLEYGRTMRGIKAAITRREGKMLRGVERDIASSFRATFVATKAECDLFQAFAPESAQRIDYIRNGVDADYFSPEREYDRPTELTGTPLVFTGAMDYRPNVDAAVYFVKSLLPCIRQRIPDARAFIVGSNPTPAVRALADGAKVVITGRVPDIRPYVAHSKVVVAPLKIARGVQNKILEGMAMGKPVIVSPEAAIGIEARAGRDFVVADGPVAFAAAVETVIRSNAGDSIGKQARQRILASYDWSTSVRRLEAALNA